MKRYSPVCFFGTGIFDKMARLGEGEYVLHSEAQAEIERLRGLVANAYAEGYADGRYGDDECFRMSDAFKSITHHSPTPNQQ